MQKDFKIGMLIGLVLVGGTGLWLSTRPSLSAKARMQTSNLRQNPAKHPHLRTISLSKNKIGPTPSGAQQNLDGLSTADQNRPYVNTEPKEHHRQQEMTNQTHIVREGETLSDISLIYYKSHNKWKKIFDANTDKINNPNTLKPGARLIIPPE